MTPERTGACHAPIPAKPSAGPGPTESARLTMEENPLIPALPLVGRDRGSICRPEPERVRKGDIADAKEDKEQPSA